MVNQAEKLCGGRAVFVLEGGYMLNALSESVTGIVKVLSGEKVRLPKKHGGAGIMGEFKEILGNYWDI